MSLITSINTIISIKSDGKIVGTAILQEIKELLSNNPHDLEATIIDKESGKVKKLVRIKGTQKWRILFRDPMTEETCFSHRGVEHTLHFIGQNQC